MHAAATLKPASLRELFWAFSWLSLQGFGGVLAVVHRELVEHRRWLSPEGFLEDWAVAQVMPGPNVCNLALMFGDRHFGWRGALTALAGLLALPMVVLIGLSILVTHLPNQTLVAGGLRGVGAVAAGLIAGSALKMLFGLRQHTLGFPVVLGLVVSAFGCVVVWHLPLHGIVLGVGGLACFWTWWSLRPRRVS